MNPKTEEIVATLRHCATHNCIMCPAYTPPNSKCFETLAAACDRLEWLEKELSKLKAQQRWIPVTERLPDGSCAAWLFDRDSRGERSIHLAFFVEKTGWMPPITSEKDAYWQHILEPEPPKEG